MTQETAKLLRPLYEETVRAKEALDQASKDMSAYYAKGESVPQSLLLSLATLAPDYQKSLEKLQKAAEQAHLKKSSTLEDIASAIEHAAVRITTRSVFLSFLLLTTDDPDLSSTLTASQKRIFQAVARARGESQTEQALSGCREIMDAMRSHSRALSDTAYATVEERLGRPIARAVDRGLFSYARTLPAWVQLKGRQGMMAPASAEEISGLWELLEGEKPASAVPSPTEKGSSSKARTASRQKAEKNREKASPSASVAVPGEPAAPHAEKKKVPAWAHTLAAYMVCTKVMMPDDRSFPHSQTQKALDMGWLQQMPVTVEGTAASVSLLTASARDLVPDDFFSALGLPEDLAATFFGMPQPDDMTPDYLRLVQVMRMDHHLRDPKDSRMLLSCSADSALPQAVCFLDGRAVFRFLDDPDNTEALLKHVRRFRQTHAQASIEILCRNEEDYKKRSAQWQKHHMPRKNVVLRLLETNSRPASADKAKKDSAAKKPNPVSLPSAESRLPKPLHLHGAYASLSGSWAYSIRLRSLSMEEQLQELRAHPEQVLALLIALESRFFPVEHTTARNGLHAMQLDETGKTAVKEDTLRELFQKKLLVRYSVRCRDKKYDSYIPSLLAMECLRSLNASGVYCAEPISSDRTFDPDAVSASEAFQIQRIHECTLSRREPVLPRMQPFPEGTGLIMGCMPGQSASLPSRILPAIPARGQENAWLACVKDYLAKHPEEKLLILCEFPSDLQTLRSALQPLVPDQVYFCVRGTPDKLIEGASNQVQLLPPQPHAPFVCSLQMNGETAVVKQQAMPETPALAAEPEDLSRVAIPALPPMDWSLFPDPLEGITVRLTGGGGQMTMTEALYSEDLSSIRHLTELLAILHRRLILLPEDIGVLHSALTENDIRSARRFGYLSDLTVRSPQRAALYLTLSEKAWSCLRAPFYPSYAQRAGLPLSPLSHPWWNAGMAVQVQLLHDYLLQEDYALGEPLSASGIVPAYMSGALCAVFLPQKNKADAWCQDFCRLYAASPDRAMHVLLLHAEDMRFLWNALPFAMHRSKRLIPVCADDQGFHTLAWQQQKAVPESCLTHENVPDAPERYTQALNFLKQSPEDCALLSRLLRFQVMAPNALAEPLRKEGLLCTLEAPGDAALYLTPTDFAFALCRAHPEALDLVNMAAPVDWNTDNLYRALAEYSVIEHTPIARTAFLSTAVQNLVMLSWRTEKGMHSLLAVTLADMDILPDVLSQLAQDGIQSVAFLPDSDETSENLRDSLAQLTSILPCGLWNEAEALSALLPDTPFSLTPWTVSSARLSLLPCMAQLSAKNGLKELILYLYAHGILDTSAILPEGIDEESIAYADRYGYLDRADLTEGRLVHSLVRLSDKGRAVIQHPRCQTVLGLSADASAPDLADRSAMEMADLLLLSQAVARENVAGRITAPCGGVLGWEDEAGHVTLALSRRPSTETLHSLQNTCGFFPVTLLTEKDTAVAPHPFITSHALLDSAHLLLHLPERSAQPSLSDTELLDMAQHQAISHLYGEALDLLADGNTAGLVLLRLLSPMHAPSDEAYGALHSGMAGDDASPALQLLALAGSAARHTLSALQGSNASPLHELIQKAAVCHLDDSVLALWLCENLTAVFGTDDALRPCLDIAMRALEGRLDMDIPRLLLYTPSIPLSADGQPVTLDEKCMLMPLGPALLARHIPACPCDSLAACMESVQAYAAQYAGETGTLQAIAALYPSDLPAFLPPDNDTSDRTALESVNARKREIILRSAQADHRIQTDKACAQLQSALSALHDACSALACPGYESRLLDLALRHPNRIGKMSARPHPKGLSAAQQQTYDALYRAGHSYACETYLAQLAVFADADDAYEGMQRTLLRFLSGYDDNYRASVHHEGIQLADIYRQRHFERDAQVKEGEKMLMHLPQNGASKADILSFLQTMGLPCQNAVEKERASWECMPYEVPQGIPLRALGPMLPKTGLHVRLLRSDTPANAEAMLTAIDAQGALCETQPCLLLCPFAIPFNERKRLTMRWESVANRPPLLLLDAVLALFLAESDGKKRYADFLACALPFAGLANAREAFFQAEMPAPMKTVEELMAFGHTQNLILSQEMGRSSVIDSLLEAYSCVKERRFGIALALPDEIPLPDQILTRLRACGCVPPSLKLPEKKWPEKIRDHLIGQSRILLILDHADQCREEILRQIMRLEEERIHVVLVSEAPLSLDEKVQRVALPPLSLESAERTLLAALALAGRSLGEYPQRILLPALLERPLYSPRLQDLLSYAFRHTPASLVTPPLRLDAFPLAID